MRITYDAEADALYLHLREGETARTREAGAGIQIDEDAEGRILGIEVIGYSELVDAESLRSVSVSLPLPG